MKRSFLVLSLSINEDDGITIYAGDDSIRITSLGKKPARLYFEAPRHVLILRDKASVQTNRKTNHSQARQHREDHADESSS